MYFVLISANFTHIDPFARFTPTIIHEIFDSFVTPFASSFFLVLAGFFDDYIVIGDAQSIALDKQNNRFIGIQMGSHF